MSKANLEQTLQSQLELKKLELAADARQRQIERAYGSAVELSSFFIEVSRLYQHYVETNRSIISIVTPGSSYDPYPATGEKVLQHRLPDGTLYSDNLTEELRATRETLLKKVPEGRRLLGAIRVSAPPSVYEHAVDCINFLETSLYAHPQPSEDGLLKRTEDFNRVVHEWLTHSDIEKSAPSRERPSAK